MQIRKSYLLMAGALLVAPATRAQNQSLQDLLKSGVKRGGTPPAQQQPQSPQQRPAPAVPAAIVPQAAGSTREHRDESGFSVSVPEGWQVRKFERGVITIAGQSPSKYVLLMPILGRTMDCATSLRNNLTSGWPAYPGASDVVVETVNRGAVARFLFQQRQSRGVILCAETGPRTGMMYGISAPVNEFAREQPLMVAVLKSFRYGGRGSAELGKPPAAALLPPMTKWREANEGAFVIPIPEGWKMEGGIARLSNTDVRGGIRAWSPDRTSMIQFNDVRIDKVLVPGRQPLPNAQMGRGWRMGPHQTGLQMAEWYLQQAWASDLGLSSIEMTNRQDRPDLNAAADEVPARMGVRGIQHTFGEISFRAMRQGQPVEGRLLGMTRMMWTPDPGVMGGNFETEMKGFVGPAGSAATLARIGGLMEANCEYNYQWVAANRQAASHDVRMTLNHMRAAAEMQRKAFWERMAAADRRREAVNDVLGGRMRLRDDQGHEYEARSGSNYYFYDEEAGRTAARPDDAVVGVDVYPSPVVDLRPLEVIR